MTTEAHDDRKPSQPLGLGSTEGLGPDAEWARAWFEARYEASDVFLDGAEGLTLEAAADFVRDARTAERERLRDVLQACQRHLACNTCTNELQALYQRVRAEVERA